SAAAWWDRASQLTDTSGRVPTMGREDGRPKRRTYTGDDYSLTMPSHASVRRFAATVERRTGDPSRPFEMPIEYTGPDGDSVMRAVRVSKQGRSYDVQMPSAFDPERRAQVSESVRATLESRRPTSTRDHTAQPAAPYRHRVAGSGVLTRRAASRWINDMRYHDEAPPATTVLSPTRHSPPGAYGEVMDPDTWRRTAADRSAGNGHHAYIRRAGNTI